MIAKTICWNNHILNWGFGVLGFFWDLWGFFEILGILWDFYGIFFGIYGILWDLWDFFRKLIYPLYGITVKSKISPAC